MKLNYNICYNEYEKKFNKLSPEMRILQDAPIGNYNLRVLKRSRKEINVGDVFALSVESGVYFFGKVLKKIIKNDAKDWFHKCLVTIIFKKKYYSKNITEFQPNYDDILIGPDILTSGYWNYGYFETIGNIPLTEEEKKLDYGFFDLAILGGGGTFVDADGHEINHIPNRYSIYGIRTYTAIYSELRFQAILDSSLIDSKSIYDVFPLVDQKELLTGFDKEIQPFYFVKDEGRSSICLNTGEYKQELFREKEKEGFEGNGYDWELLAKVFIEDKMEKNTNDFEFDSEAGMFCIYSAKTRVLKRFATEFKKTCEDDELIKELFHRVKKE